MNTEPRVVAVSCAGKHVFSKQNQDSIRLIAGFGVEGDAHGGATVQHRSRWKKSEPLPNLRQVHLIAAEQIEALRGKGYRVAAGAMGENVTTSALDLLSLPEGTLLAFGEAEIRITGLRTPCTQLNKFQDGLMGEMIERSADGKKTAMKAGIMAVVTRDGVVAPGATIRVTLPPAPHKKLRPV
jgi:hypothetical protein